MCGIAGILAVDPQCVPERESLERMVRSIAHRGPDGAGFHLEPGVGLGHARLSIIDLSGGAQPIHNEDQTVWITYNGEVFNYIELRETLEQRGHRFYTQTDTEVLVHLYEEKGERFVEDLNGQFAFALWDRGKRKLILARDRAGILPLYYAETPTAFVFGSEVKALLASGVVSPELDPDALDEVMTFWGPIAPRSMFRGVSQLRPGESVIVEPGRPVRRHTYWDWRFPPDGQHVRAAHEDLQARLRDTLAAATEIRLRADVPVGAYLSGGVDSSALVALLKERVPHMLRTFAIGFEDAALDESKFQRMVVDHLETDHSQVQCATADIARVFPKTIWHGEAPVLRTAPAPMQVLSRLVRGSDVRVVLTGEGADEVLGGYDIFKESKVRHFWARQPASRWRPTLLKRLYPYLDVTSAQSDSYLREFFGTGLNTPNDPCFSHLPRWATTAQCKMFWSEEFRSRVAGSAVERFRTSLPDDVSGWHYFNRAEYVEAKTLLPSYLLSSQGDRMLMSNSVEGRFPYLDHRLIEFANALHPNYKMRVMKEKYLFKRAMRGRLLPEILDRHKQPYRAPDAAAFLGPGAPDYVTELMGKNALIRHGYFDPEKVSLLVAKLRRARVSAARDNMAFVCILSTQLWHAQFVAGQRIE
jgi:asparagine synthase (glutamine-hydrolysing)